MRASELTARYVWFVADVHIPLCTCKLQITWFVQSEVLTLEAPKDRAQAISHFINIALVRSYLSKERMEFNYAASVMPSFPPPAKNLPPLVAVPTAA